MQYRLTAPASLHASVQLPASKSISNRALILHALSGGATRPENLSDCDDTQVMIRALDHMPDVIDIHAAGTAMRFLTAYLCVTPGTHVITGTERMQQRPIRILVDALRTLGARIEYAGNEGFPPLRITGTRLTGSEIELAGNVSSQYISALLMIGAVLPAGLKLQLTGDIVSRPYINLTLQLMHDFGAQAGWTSESSIAVTPGGYRDTPFCVESDWSAASYWYAFAALTPRATLRLPDLYQDSLQGDARVAELFSRLGVNTNYHEKYVELTRTSACVEELTNDFTNQPDLAQTFVVTCALLGIRFRFSGLQSLKIKETDRMAALIKEMKKLGYLLREEAGSVLIWDGERCEPDACPAIDTYEDHRMAMAFAPACFKFKGLQINEPQVVSKSYPDFWKDLQTAGFQIKEA